MDVEGEGSRRRRTRPSRHHWRSVSWTGGRGGCLDDTALCCDAWGEREESESTDSIEVATGVGNDALAEGSGTSQNTPQLLYPPLQSLSVSRRGGGELTGAGKGRKMRNGVDIKLDLGAMQETLYHDGEEEEGVHLKREKMAQCNKQCSRILAHVYFGGNTIAQNYDILHSCKITHILNCVGYVCPEYFPKDFQYKTLWLQDSPSEDIVSILYNVFDLFEDVREQGGRVFVHCIQGVSRSASLVIAYLMWVERLTYEEAFEKVKELRCVTSPNVGFVFQLLQWQSRILGSPNRPNLRMYRMAPYCSVDPLHLVPKSVTNPSIRALDSRGAFVLQLSTGVYVWRGKSCSSLLAAAADHAAFQLVRYEHALGPIMCVREGSVPPELNDVLCSFQAGSAGDETHRGKCIAQEQELFNPDYTSDFDMIQQAQAGVYVPPMLGGCQLPARDGNWGLPRSSKKNCEG